MPAATVRAALVVVARPQPPEHARRRVHLIAAADSTPSGVPPTPQSRSTPVSGRTAISEPATSPSVISRMRRAVRADPRDLLVVPRAVEDHDHQVADADAAPLGDAVEDVLDRVGQREQVGDVRAAGHLLHVDARARVEHRAALRQRDHAERVRLALRGQRRALQRVDRDVDGGRRAVADALAVVEHRRLVLLALADHDDAVHRDVPTMRAHRVDGGPVGGVLVAAADPAAGGERRGLGHADELEGEVAVGRPRAHGREAVRCVYARPVTRRPLLRSTSTALRAPLPGALAQRQRPPGGVPRRARRLADAATS